MIIGINQWLTFYLVFPALITLGVLLSFRLRFLQCTKFFTALRLLFEKNTEGKGNLTRLEAVSAILAGNCGTGNIAGIAVALTAGGPGALIWMWIMAFFGSIIQYASCVLGAKYRCQNALGEYVGGPMYYLAHGLKARGLALCFAVAVALGAIGVGVFAQTNSMILAIAPLGITTWSAVGLMTVAVALVILGGIKRMAQVSSAIVPLMAFLYLGASCYILGLYVDHIPHAFAVLFRSAWDPQACLGGGMGYTLFQVISTGIGRALFATDVGTGYVPILQAGAQSRHPVIDGLISLVAPVMVMLVCTMTGLVLIVTGAYSVPDLKSTQMVLYAFAQGIGVQASDIVVGISLLLFGYTTVIAWACCFERAMEYIFHGRFRKPLRWVFLIFVPLSSFLHIDFVWAFADFTLTCMTLCNLTAIFGLSREVVMTSKAFFASQTSVAAEGSS